MTRYSYFKFSYRVIKKNYAKNNRLIKFTYPHSPRPRLYLKVKGGPFLKGHWIGFASNLNIEYNGASPVIFSHNLSNESSDKQYAVKKNKNVVKILHMQFKGSKVSCPQTIRSDTTCEQSQECNQFRWVPRHLIMARGLF